MGLNKKKDCGLLPGNQTENTHEFMQLFFISMQKYLPYRYLKTKCNHVIIIIEKKSKKTQIIQGK